MSGNHSGASGKGKGKRSKSKGKKKRSRSSSMMKGKSMMMMKKFTPSKFRGFVKGKRSGGYGSNRISNQNVNTVNPRTNQIQSVRDSSTISRVFTLRLNYDDMDGANLPVFIATEPLTVNAISIQGVVIPVSYNNYVDFMGANNNAKRNRDSSPVSSQFEDQQEVQQYGTGEILQGNPVKYIRLDEAAENTGENEGSAGNDNPQQSANPIVPIVFALILLRKGCSKTTMLSNLNVPADSITLNEAYSSNGIVGYDDVSVTYVPTRELLFSRVFCPWATISASYSEKIDHQVLPVVLAMNPGDMIYAVSKKGVEASPSDTTIQCTVNYRTR